MTADSSAMPKYLNVRQLAQLLNISIPTVYRKIETREVPFYRIGGVIRFNLEEIKSYLKKCRIGKAD